MKRAYGFKGNLGFCSKYALNQITLSRRDDLISVVYMLIYLYTGRLDVLDHQCQDQSEWFRKIKYSKNQATSESLCKYS